MHNISMVEAAKYTGLDYSAFLAYTLAGRVCYKLIGVERFFSRKELIRFNEEVLGGKGGN